MKPIAINSAEAVLEPFWDRNMDPLRAWRVTDAKPTEDTAPWWEELPENHYEKTHIRRIEIDNGTGAYLSDNWNGTIFGWANARPDIPVIDMCKTFEVDCAAYDTLVFSALLPPETTLHLEVKTEQGMRQGTYRAPENGKKGEYSLALEGAAQLNSVRICLTCSGSGVHSGSFQFLLLQHKAREKAYTESLRCNQEDWSPWLKDESYRPVFRPLLGLLADEKMLETLREKLNTDELVREAYKEPEPEPMVSDFVNCGTDTRFPRERDYQNDLDVAIKIAFAGILAKDETLLRKAARYALSIGMCKNWQESFICSTPGFLFDHKGFAPSIYCRVVAVILDLAGELFTPTGIQFLVRRLGEEGLASINWVVWKYSGPPEDIFDINQLVWFSWGRLPAYTAVEQYWPAAKAYTDLAYQEICDSMQRVILPDGGYEEGPTYFTSVARMAGEALYWYARARQLPFEGILPESLKRTADYAECLLSLDPSYGLIPVADGPCGIFLPDTLALLAKILPESHWVTLFRQAWKHYGSITSDMVTLLLEPEIPQEGPKMRTFLSLPDTGAVSSVREWNGTYLKIFQCGGNSGANHAHQDKGSFVIQAGGDTVAMDPGMGKYDDAIGSGLGKVHWHNMLIPIEEGALIQPDTSVGTKPKAEGNETYFHSEMDLTPTWKEFYEVWQRTLHSPTPEVLEVVDEYALRRGTGVAFCLITPLEITLKNETAVLTGAHSRTTIVPEAGCQLRQETVPAGGGRTLRRLWIETGKKRGVMKTIFRFGGKEKGESSHGI